MRFLNADSTIKHLINLPIIRWLIVIVHLVHVLHVLFIFRVFFAVLLILIVLLFLFFISWLEPSYEILYKENWGNEQSMLDVLVTYGYELLSRHLNRCQGPSAVCNAVIFTLKMICHFLFPLDTHFIGFIFRFPLHDLIKLVSKWGVLFSIFA